MLLPDIKTIVANDHFNATIVVIPSRTSLILVVIFLIQAMTGYSRTNSRNHYNFGGFNRNNNNFGHTFGGKTPCQICHSFEHEAIDCYERMNNALAGKIPPTKLAAMVVRIEIRSFGVESFVHQLAWERSACPNLIDSLYHAWSV